jgi:hypothetical protein
MIGITDRSFEIDNPVERLAGADPFVHRSTLCFAFFGVEGFSLARQKGCSEDFEVARMGAGDQLFETTDDLVGAYPCSGRLLREGCSMSVTPCRTITNFAPGTLNTSRSNRDRLLGPQIISGGEDHALVDYRRYRRSLLQARVPAHATVRLADPASAG